MDYILWNKIKNIEHSTNWNKCGNRSKVRWEVLFPFSKELCLYLSILWHFVSIYKMFLMYLSLFCSFHPPTSTFPLSPNNLVYAFYWDLFYHLLIYQYICLPTYMCAHYMHAWQRPDDGIQSNTTEFTDGCELPCGLCELAFGPLQQ